MTKFENYLKEGISDQDLDAISEKLINAKFDRDKRQAWTKILHEDYGIKKEDNKSTIFKKFKRPYFIAAAAAILLLFSFFYFSSNAGPQYLPLVDQHIKALNIMGDPSILRKGPQNIEAIRKEATLTYVKKKYVESIVFWKVITNSEAATGMDYFYLGLCQLQQPSSDPAAAIESLQKAQTYNYAQEEIAWTISLAYLKNGEKEKARASLQNIVKNKGYQHLAAADLLTAME